MKAPWNFLRYLPVAQRLIARGRIPALLLAVARKRSSHGGLLKGLREDLSLFQALCVAWWRGEYRAISKPALVSVVAALWVMRKWSDERAAFRDWRDAQPPLRKAALETFPPGQETEQR